jgi:ubiquinone/menaquinone biosynthesis C-methylase UbiE
MQIALYVLLGLIAFGVLARLQSRLSPRPFPAWMTPVLESPLRRYVADPEKTLERSGLHVGQRVLEVGPGGGYLTELALGRLGEEGRLVCLDLQLAMLRKVRARLAHRTPHLVCASGSQLPFRDGVFDLAFLVSVLGEIPDKQSAVNEYGRVLASGGVLAVTEAIPDPDYVRTHVLRRLAERAGFVAAERLGSWVHRTHRFRMP